MHRIARFVLNAAIALFLVWVSTLTIQLIAHAPMPIGGRVAGVNIHSVFIPGQAFTCDRTGQEDRCQVSLFDRPLELTMTVSNASIELTKCQLSYAGQTANCKGDFNALIIGGWQPVVSTESTLGLSAAQQSQLREQYPQRNFFLYSIGEDRLMKGGTGFAIVAGVLTFLFGWLNYSKGVLFFGIGFIVFVVGFVTSQIMLLALGYVD